MDAGIIPIQAVGHQLLPAVLECYKSLSLFHPSCPVANGATLLAAPEPVSWSTNRSKAMIVNWSPRRLLAHRARSENSKGAGGPKGCAAAFNGWIPLEAGSDEVHALVGDAAVVATSAITHTETRRAGEAQAPGRADRPEIYSSEARIRAPVAELLEA